MGFKKSKIRHVIILGDSLSDRGTLKTKRRFLARLAGLNRSPKGRFTDYLVWGDVIANQIAQKAIIEEIHNTEEEIKRLKLENQDQSKIKQKEKYLHTLRYEKIDVTHHRKIKFRGERFLRSYAEGGLTSHRHKIFKAPSIKTMATRALVSNLDRKRHRLLRDDEKYNLSDQAKKETLIIEWTGGNDIVTVNTALSKETVEMAIQSKIKNAQELLNQGYRNIVFFNLPDLSLTPRFQKRAEERQLAHDISNYFNDRLSAEVEKLKKENAQLEGLNLDQFDVNKFFKQEIEKHEAPYRTYAKKGKVMKKGELSREGILFYDDLHPTAYMQKKIGNIFFETYKDKFDVTPSPKSAKQLYEDFKSTYLKLSSTSKKRTSEEIKFEHLEKECKGDYIAMLTELFDFAQRHKTSREHLILKRLDFYNSVIHSELIVAREKILPSVKPEESLEHIYKKFKEIYTVRHKGKPVWLRSNFNKSLEKEENRLLRSRGLLQDEDYMSLLTLVYQHAQQYPHGTTNSVLKDLQFYTSKHEMLNEIRDSVTRPYYVDITKKDIYSAQELYEKLKKKYVDLNDQRTKLLRSDFAKHLNQLEQDYKHLSTNKMLSEEDYKKLLVLFFDHAKQYGHGIAHKILKESNFYDSTKNLIVEVRNLVHNKHSPKDHPRQLKAVQRDLEKLVAAKGFTSLRGIKRHSATALPTRPLGDDLEGKRKTPIKKKP